jgi:hypothetical protein
MNIANIPKAEAVVTMIGDVSAIADHVCLRG